MATTEVHEVFRSTPSVRCARPRALERPPESTLDRVSAPLETLSYQFATSARPGSIISRVLIDASAGAYAEGADLFDASGRTLASIARMQGAWAVGGSSIERPESARVDSFRHSPITVTSAGDITFASLFDEAQRHWLGSVTSSVLGHSPIRESVVPEGVSRRVTTTVSFAGGRVLHTTRENGSLLRLHEMNGEGQVVALSDASGARAQIAYDALGRVPRIRPNWFGQLRTSPSARFGRSLTSCMVL